MNYFRVNSYVFFLIYTIFGVYIFFMDKPEIVKVSDESAWLQFRTPIFSPR